MQPLESISGQSKDMVHGTIVSASPHTSSPASQVGQLESGQQLMVPAEALLRQPDGTYYY